MKPFFLMVFSFLIYSFSIGQHVGIGTSNPLSKLHIENGGLMVSGDSGQVPMAGQGNRLMWVPAKSAFRAGKLDASGANYWNSDSMGFYSFAAGKNVRATGDSASVSLGWYSRATGKFGSIALGDFAHASGNSGASAIGGYVTAAGFSSIAIGQNANALGDYSQSIGNSSVASGYASTSMGTSDTVSSPYSYAIGFKATTEGSFLGNTSIGYVVKSSAGSLALGHFTNATGEASMALGRFSAASATNALLFGRLDTASGSNSIVVGHENKGTANYAKVFGNNSVASGNGSMALGAGVSALSAFAVAIGNSSRSAGSQSFTLGTFDTAFAEYSFAIGTGSKAFGSYSYSAGTFTTARGNYSLALGYGGTADGVNANSIGNFNSAGANFSTALGTANRSGGDYGLSTGYRNVQKAYGGFTAGLFNDTTDASFPFGPNAQNRIFQVGNGTDDNARSNAITVLQNGNVGIGVLNPELNLVVRNDVRIDANNENNGNISRSLRFGNNVTGEAIASKRTAGGNQWGLDFYTNNQIRLGITNAGVVQVANNLTVQNGKGIIRTTDGTQKKQLSASVVINTSFAAGETKQFAITWPEAFAAAPDAYVGNVTGGSGGWAEVVMTVFNATATGAVLFVYNPRSVAAAPNFTIKVIAIGPQ